MRRCVAFLVALVFSWLLMLPAFAGSAAANLPPCCRKHGKHHCQMSGSQDVSISAAHSQCPYFLHTTPAGHIEAFTLATNQAVFSGVVSHPSISPQTAAGYRISHYRSKQKRGPPSFLLS
jgi:hypothetical protein